jgi:phosphotriesterase-related protein
MRSMVPNWHFGYIFDEILPALREGGVTDEQITTMMEENPARWLAA